MSEPLIWCDESCFSWESLWIPKRILKPSSLENCVKPGNMWDISTLIHRRSSASFGGSTTPPEHQHIQALKNGGSETILSFWIRGFCFESQGVYLADHWLTTMVSKSPNRGYSPSKWPKFMACKWGWHYSCLLTGMIIQAFEKWPALLRDYSGIMVVI